MLHKHHLGYQVPTSGLLNCKDPTVTQRKQLQSDKLLWASNGQKVEGKFLFNREKPQTEPNSGRDRHLLWGWAEWERTKVGSLWKREFNNNWLKAKQYVNTHPCRGVVFNTEKPINRLHFSIAFLSQYYHFRINFVKTKFTSKRRILTLGLRHSGLHCMSEKMLYLFLSAHWSDKFSWSFIRKSFSSIKTSRKHQISTGI